MTSTHQDQIAVSVRAQGSLSVPEPWGAAASWEGSRLPGPGVRPDEGDEAGIPHHGYRSPTGRTADPRRFDAVPEWADFCIHHRDTIFRQALRYLGREHEQDAEDLTQEVCLQARHFLPRFQGRNRAQLRTYVYAITRNQCCRWLKRQILIQQRRVSLDDEAIWTFMEPTADPRGNVEWEVVERRYRVEWLKGAIRRLPEPFRAAVVQVEVYDMPVREAADLLGVRATTLAMRLSRGRKLLRRWWEQEHTERRRSG